MSCLAHHILHELVLVNTLCSHFGGFFNYLISVTWALIIVLALTCRRFYLCTEESVQEAMLSLSLKVICWLVTLRHFWWAKVVINSLEVLGDDWLFCTGWAFALRPSLRVWLSLLHEVDASLSVTFPWLSQWLVWNLRFTLFSVGKVRLALAFSWQLIKIWFNRLLVIWLEFDSATWA